MFCTSRCCGFAPHGDEMSSRPDKEPVWLLLTRDPCQSPSSPHDTSLWCSGASVKLTVARYELVFRWGHSHELGSSAYWIDQARRAPTSKFNLGETLAEEVIACVVGGYGMPARVGIAGFRALKTANLVRTAPPPSATEVERVLRQPLNLGDGRMVRYRFPTQRAVRVANCLGVLASTPAPENPMDLRAWLLRLPGIGPKTASWIVRNHCASSDVAIIDIHVQRAGIAAGFFSSGWLLPRDYALFEAAFLEVARVGRVPAAALDACIWQQLQWLGQASALILSRPFDARRRRTMRHRNPRGRTSRGNASADHSSFPIT
jgi:N-glycosylase/DNA lyase